MDNFPLKKETYGIIGVCMEGEAQLAEEFFLATNYTN
jgi:hypothetical protein